MVNPFKDTNWNPDLEERKKFARSLVIGFPILGILIAAMGRLTHGEWPSAAPWIGTVGCAAGILFWLVPQIAKPFYLGWYFVACCIGIVVSNLLLAMFYFVAITPIGLIMRAIGRDPMSRRLDRDAKTYWRDAEKIADLQRYLRQY